MNEYTVERAVRSMFGLVKDVMEEGNFDSIYLMYLGRFEVKPKRLEYLNKHKQHNNESKHKDLHADS
jgi:hypothetical protein